MNDIAIQIERTNKCGEFGNSQKVVEIESLYCIIFLLIEDVAMTLLSYELAF